MIHQDVYYVTYSKRPHYKIKLQVQAWNTGYELEINFTFKKVHLFKRFLLMKGNDNHVVDR